LIILFDSERVEKEFNSAALLQKHHGSIRAKLIQRRLTQLAAANILEDMRSLPGRCHELTGNLAGQLAVDLDGPYRLLFEPADEPIPLKPDGGFDWTRITAIRILGVTNYHD
jgi:plasmid maintenance system killer protein